MIKILLCLLGLNFIKIVSSFSCFDGWFFFINYRICSRYGKTQCLTAKNESLRLNFCLFSKKHCACSKLHLFFFSGESDVYEPISCVNGTSWCLKFVNAENSNSYRRCDNFNEFCPNYGDKCGSIEIHNITELPYAHLMCCCNKENCNHSTSSKNLYLLIFVVVRFLFNQLIN